RVQVRERASELVLARLVGARPGKSRLGGFITSIERVVNVGAPLVVLVSPDGGEVAVDWEATLAQPEMRETQELPGA
ncbi:MAG TPA: hypothetical protein VHF89_11060, partial [Solirubrobacteraceae bacterium]|nr:hypothetical protein [Solirubrobacteraceae bacterium]